MEKMLVSGVAADKKYSQNFCAWGKDEPGIAFRLFNLLARYRIKWISLSSPWAVTTGKIFPLQLPARILQETMKIINDHLEMLTADSVSADDTVAKNFNYWSRYDQ